MRYFPSVFSSPQTGKPPQIFIGVNITPKPVDNTLSLVFGKMKEIYSGGGPDPLQN